ncbi:RagB/SusD family nutrient uptake outer membrane protein [Arcticibacterium luteifluviistationis]|uniref:RagB/SusD family nutrient uptake outer membrane protein n=1 Tax=Arcticibacterium luteifluviistationis TaxID=1784714 RepID=A0A2Z4GAU1_9BACT|nr:RagB/SusD family nutrient uptake outer membrane protein [Arcticibacterium luteifluviistationis]AWV98392.1 RagB/SusD family nutrient uptake outer membrane protein [Arcticibacterium luteifluviistationis]
MKRMNYMIAALVGTVLLSCDSSYLEPAPTSGITSGNFYTNAAEVETAVINMYDGIQGTNSTSSNDNHGVMYEFYVTEMRSDNTKTKSFEGEQAQFEDFSITPNNGVITDYYASFYNVIARANVVLENLDAVADAGTKAAFESEAKFIRAYAYFNLVRLYGDIPLIDKTISPLDKEIQFTRASTSSIYSLIVSDLTTAVAGLNNTYRTRASKAAAQALLAKVYLTQGSNYSEAKTLLESVMSSGYSLESNFKDIFYKEDNNEVIFGIGYASDLSSDSQNFSGEMLNAVGRTTGVNYVTAEAKAAIDAGGGNRAMYSYRQDKLQNEFNQVVKYLPNGDEDLGIAATSSNATLAGNDWIVLRYADVLLMHAEAIMAGGAETSDASAIASFQAVRNRAGLTDAVTSISKADLLAERRVELAFENHRFFDLVRFNEAESVLTKYSADNGYSFSATDLLLPIPQREINLSQGVLSQNPGY